MTEAELSRSIEVVRGRLYYMACRIAPTDRPDVHFFCVDDTLHYWPFFKDFGPLSLGNLYRFCHILNAKLSDKALLAKRIVLFSGPQMQYRANCVYLLAAYSLLYLGKTPDEAYRPFLYISPPLAPWHDASPGIDPFHLTCVDVLRGIAKARECRFFSFDSFSLEEYEHYERVENGDMNWIVEGRFLAFAGPHDTRLTSPEGYHTTCVDDLIPYFKRKGVSAVVRLNKKYYNEKRFTSVGIDHYDMYYLDGSNPPEPILQRFLAVVEQTPNAIAVHCKAGLGRTGTCIGAYLMKHYRMTAREVIGWMRVCRPGSVIGPQQQFLEEIQDRMWEEGEVFRRLKRLPMPVPGSLLAEAQSKLSVTSPSGRSSDESEDAYLTHGMAAIKLSGEPRLQTAFSPASPSKGTSALAKTSSSRSVVSTNGGDMLPPLGSTPTAGRRALQTTTTTTTTSYSSASLSSGGKTTSTTKTLSGLTGSSSRTIGTEEFYVRDSDTPTTMLSVAMQEEKPLRSGHSSGQPLGYATPGSSPLSTNMLKARSRTGTEYVSSSSAGVVPSRPSGGPSVSPLSIPTTKTPTLSSPSRYPAATKGGFGTPASPEAELEFSQGDMLRSAKSRSPMLSASSPGAGLRFAGSGVVAPGARSPGSFGLSSPITASGSPTLSRYTQRR